MTKQNAKQLFTGVTLGALLMSLAAMPAQWKHPTASTVVRDPVVLGHRINSMGQEQLIYASEKSLKF